jgi:hypothetical protein
VPDPGRHRHRTRRKRRRVVTDGAAWTSGVATPIALVALLVARGRLAIAAHTRATPTYNWPGA